MVPTCQDTCNLSISISHTPFKKFLYLATLLAISGLTREAHAKEFNPSMGNHYLTTSPDCVQFVDSNVTSNERTLWIECFAIGASKVGTIGKNPKSGLLLHNSF